MQQTACLVINPIIVDGYALSLALCYLCYFVLVFSSPFSNVITLLGKERANLLFARLFDLLLFGFVCFLFHLVSGKGCSL